MLGSILQLLSTFFPQNTSIPLFAPSILHFFQYKALFFFPFVMQKKNANHLLTDEEVVAQIQQSQSPALIDVLYARYSDKVFRKCMSFVKKEAIAKDLTHDIFIKVYLNLSSFKNRSKFSTWLYAITYNFCVDHLRKSRRLQTINPEDHQQMLSNIPDEEINSLEELQGISIDRLSVLLEQIKEEEKMILLMKYKDGLSIKDLQKIFDISESAVKMRLKRAKEKVRKMYDEKYPEFLN